MHRAIKIALVMAASVAPFVAGNSRAAELIKPECEALETWAATVDPRDRYTPLPGNNTWAPKAFGEPAFAELFGKPTLELTRDELDELGDHMGDCQKAATQAKRYDAQKTLNLARGMLVGRVNKVINVSEALAKSRKVEKTSEEPQREKAPTRQKPSSAQPAEAASAQAAGLIKPECEALETWAATVDPRDRYTPLPGNNTWAPKAFGEPAFAELFGKPALELTRDELDELGDQMGDCQKAATQAKRYDAQKTLNLARGMLVGRLSNVLTAAEGMAEAREVEKAAQEAHRKREATRIAREQRQREESLSNYLSLLLGQPDSPELLRDLALLRSDQLPSRNELQTPFARNYRDQLFRWDKSPHDPEIAEPIKARIAELREPLLADLEARIDALPSNGEGLRNLNEILGEAYRKMGPALSEADRERLQGRAGKRRESMRADITRLSKQNIANLPETMESFRTLRRWDSGIKRMDVTPEQRSEIAEAARTRQVEIAETVLAKAQADLQEIPETLDGLRQVDEVARAASQVRLAASGSVREAFHEALKDRQAEIRREAFPEFEARMAAVPETRKGLERAEEWVSKTQAAPRAVSMREAYIDAAVARRDKIKAVLDEQDRERREAAISMGGDQRLVGLEFVEPKAGMRLEFRDEERVFMNALGIRAAGSYEVSRDDVIVNGPNGQMVLKIDGDTLRGMGLSFKRQY